jgi:PAS domain S-box-containing protein
MSSREEKNQEPIKYTELLDENHALKAEIQSMRVRLEEGDELKRAIRERDLDALVFHEQEEDLVFTLNNADRAYRTLVETMNEGTVTLGFDSIILYCNCHFAELLRTPPQTIVGTSIYRLIAPEDEITFKEFLEKGIGKREIKLQVESGISLPVYISINSLGGKESLNALCIVVTDMTELKKAEEKLRESEEKYRNIVETANEGILIIDDEAVVTYANKKLTDILGYALEEGVGKPIWGFVSEESRDVVKLNLEKSRQGINDSYELKLIKKDSSSVWIHLSYKSFFNKDGKFVGSLSMLTDINDRKKADETLKLKLEELARSNEELEQFAYILSHDLEEPLRMITIYLQLLQRKYKGNLDDKADKYIYFAVEGASRIQNRINDLL